MTKEEMVIFISDKVVSDVQFWIALIGLIGVIVGGIITVIGNIILHNHQQKKQNKNDKARKSLLKTMLDDNKRFPDGRSLEVLSKVTGSSLDDCRRLLIELDARGFTMKDGREGWTYIKNLPLHKSQ